MKKQKQNKIVKIKYNTLLDRIGEIISQTRVKVVREINKAQVLAYWEIGREIVEFERKERQGQIMVKNCSKDFQQTCLANLTRCCHSLTIANF